ncbi:MAG: hypothetical protein E7672_08915 [Ruminococcaceae bacterium]|nr:hypothetical protein [Oscillospiraceae bacterium]
MLTSLLLLVCVIFVSLQNVVTKFFKQKCSGGDICFSAMSAGFALLIFAAVLLFEGKFSFNLTVLLFSVLFAIAYGVSTVFLVLAIGCGSVAQTTLITSYSLLIPTFFGIIFLKETAGAATFFGIIFLAVSLFLTYYSKSDEKPTAKWIGCVILSFIGNGMCSTVQKLEPIYCDADSGNIFMIVALLMNTVFLMLFSFMREGKAETVTTVKKGWHFAAMCGLMNGVVNLLVMILNNRIAASVLFPIVSAGNLVITFLLSVALFHEKFSKRQIGGFIVGVAAVVILNL